MDIWEDLRQIISYQIEAYGGNINPKDDFNGFIQDIKKWREHCFLLSEKKPEYTPNKPKPTVAELEEMLSKPSGYYQIRINPDGSITTVEDVVNLLRELLENELINGQNVPSLSWMERAKKILGELKDKEDCAYLYHRKK